MRHARSAVTLLAVLAVPRGAGADVETRVPFERLVSAPGGAGLWVTEDAHVTGHLRVLLDLGWSVAGAPVELHHAEQKDGGDRIQVVRRLTSFQLAGTVELWRQLRLALALPLSVPAGEGLQPVGGESLPSAMVGDLRVHGTASLWPGTPRGFQVAATVVLSLPTGDRDAFGGVGAVGAEPRILLTVQPVDVLTIRAQVGARFHERRSLFGATWGNRLTWAGCVELGLPWRRSSFVARNMTLLFEADGESCPACAGPVELRGGLRVRWGRWSLSIGGGGGVVDAVTVPSWRVLGSLGVVVR